MKMKWVAAVAVVLAAAVLVYAWAYDTDGGYQPMLKGTCTWINSTNTTYNISYTDYCIDGYALKEYFPVGYNASAYCGYSTVDCSDYNYFEDDCWYTYTCYKGACKEHVTCEDE